MKTILGNVAFPASFFGLDAHARIARFRLNPSYTASFRAARFVVYAGD